MPIEDILQMENELKNLKIRLENFKKQSLSSSDDTPNVLDTSEQAKVREFEKMIETMEVKLSHLKSSRTYLSGGVSHEDTWDPHEN
jgi:hypothetical protein